MSDILFLISDFCFSYGKWQGSQRNLPFENLENRQKDITKKSSTQIKCVSDEIDFCHIQANLSLLSVQALQHDRLYIVIPLSIRGS